MVRAALEAFERGSAEPPEEGESMATPGELRADALAAVCERRPRAQRRGGDRTPRGHGARRRRGPRARRGCAGPLRARGRRGAGGRDRGDCKNVPRENRARGIDPSPTSLLPTDGGRFDMGLAVDAMYWFTHPPPEAEDSA